MSKMNKCVFFLSCVIIECLLVFSSYSQSIPFDSLILNADKRIIVNPVLISINQKSGNKINVIMSEGEENFKMNDIQSVINSEITSYIVIGAYKIGSFIFGIDQIKTKLDTLILNCYFQSEECYVKVELEEIFKDKRKTIYRIKNVPYFITGIINVKFYNRYIVNSLKDEKLEYLNSYIPFAIPYFDNVTNEMRERYYLKRGW